MGWSKGRLGLGDACEHERKRLHLLRQPRCQTSSLSCEPYCALPVALGMPRSMLQGPPAAPYREKAAFYTATEPDTTMAQSHPVPVRPTNKAHPPVHPAADFPREKALCNLFVNCEKSLARRHAFVFCILSM